MKVHVHKRSGKFLGTLDISDDATVDELKDLFYQHYHYYPERQRFSAGSPKGPLLISGPLQKNGVTDGTAVYFKDLGVQISWRLVFVLEYLGPLILMPLFWYYPNLFYSENSIVSAPHPRSSTQLVCVILFLFHFAKRELESLFVHRFSNATMPLVRLPLNCTHYWLLCTCGIGYFLCHPKYKAPFQDSCLVLYPLAVLFLIFETLNFKTHLILRNLRPRGTKERGIPQNWGFQWASCANYTWEVAAWITFSFMSMTLTSFIFCIVAFTQMAIWALKKHQIYKKTFPHYPRSRRAIIPFLL